MRATDLCQGGAIELGASINAAWFNDMKVGTQQAIVGFKADPDGEAEADKRHEEPRPATMDGPGQLRDRFEMGGLFTHP